MSRQLNILDLEIKYSELQEFLSGHYSKRAKLFKISDFISQVFQQQNPNTAEAYLSELIPQYLEYISTLEPRGNDPKLLKNLLDQLDQIKKYKFAEAGSELINTNIFSLTSKINLLNDWLNDINTFNKKAIYFPVLEKIGSNYSNGFLESIEVEIKSGENKFHITPSESENDVELEKQIKLCWQIALSICKKHTNKIKPSHTVFIHFVNRYGIYSGSSFGVALTLALVEALLKYYNTPRVININSSIAFTGESDESGIIKSTDENIIKEKVKTIFFSDVESFALSIDSLPTAKAKYEELKKDYPNRKLELIGIESVDDLLNRRNLVDIKKQKLAIRTGKFIRKNWTSAAAVLLLTMIFTFLFAFDFDDNPTSLTSDGNTLFVKNKKGKVLWDKRIAPINPKILDWNYLNCLARIIDIDNNGTNEVLITNQILENKSSINDFNSIRCYTSRGSLIWKYEIKDEVYSKREKLNTEYSIHIIDTLTFNKRKSLFLYSSNGPSYSAVIYRIDLRTGKRLPGSLWASGHITGAIIKDTDNDGKSDMIGLGFDNGFEDVVLFVYDIDTTNNVRLTTEEYFIKNFPLAKMKAYLRFPKTDLDIYYHQRTPKLDYEIPEYNTTQNEYRFNFNNLLEDNSSSISFHISPDFKEVTPFIKSRFRVLRDSLVAEGKLKLPYTDTEEYKNIIKNNILYWQDNKWVHRKDLK